MKKEYFGWRGVIKLAKELGYSWQEACEVLYRKKINPKTTFDQIIICARIKYELEFIKAGGFLTNYKDGRIIKPNRFEKEIVPEIKVVEEQLVKKVEVKKKEPFVFKTAEPYRKDYSRLVYWCNPHEPINKGKLGSSQSWRKKETFKGYY